MLFCVTYRSLQSPEVTAELFVEVLGCLANLYIPEFDFFQLVRKHDLLHFLATYAQPGAGRQLCCWLYTLPFMPHVPCDGSSAN